MLKLYIDDSDFTSPWECEDTYRDLFLLGGLIIPSKDERELNNSIRLIKSEYYSMYPYFPLKWNFKDLQEHYLKIKMVPIYKELLQNSNTWRKAIFNKISALNITIICSLIKGYSEKKDKDLTLRPKLLRYAYSNILQRAALHVKDSRNENGMEVILDWPDSKTARAKPFDYEYLYAYGFGLTYSDADDVGRNKYFSGPLSELNFYDAPKYCSTVLCNSLQICDMIVAVIREFTKFALGEKHQDFGLEMFRLIMGKIRGAPNPKEILERGFIISAESDFKGRKQEIERMIMVAYKKLLP